MKILIIRHAEPDYPNNTLTDKICKLLEDYPCIDISAMGFPADWLKEELWKG